MNIEIKFRDPARACSLEEIQRLNAIMAAGLKPLAGKIITDLGRYAVPPPSLTRNTWTALLKPLTAFNEHITDRYQGNGFALADMDLYSLPQVAEAAPIGPANWKPKNKDGMLYFADKNNPAHIKVLHRQHGQKRWVEILAN